MKESRDASKVKRRYYSLIGCLCLRLIKILRLLHERARIRACLSSLSLCHKGNGNINFVPGDNKLLVFVFLDEFQLGELFDVLVNVSICTV